MKSIALAANWSEFWSELWDGINKFFNPDLSGYTNFSFGSSGIINIHVIVIGIFAGAMVAAIYSIYTKKILGEMVRKMLDMGAVGAENAISLDALGLSKNILIKHALKGYTLGRVVNSIEKDDFIKETNDTRTTYEENRKKLAKQGKRIPAFVEPTFKKKIEECHFYISEEKKYTAEMRFNAEGSGYGTFFFVLLISFICVIIIYSLLPQILLLVDKSLNEFTVQGNTYVPGQ